MLITLMAGTRTCCRFKCLVNQFHNVFRLRPLHSWSDVGYLRISRTLHLSCALLSSKINRPKYHQETEAFIKFTEEQSQESNSEEGSPELARKRLNEGLVITNGEEEFNGTLTDVVMSRLSISKGTEKSPVGVGGDSSGGTLAATVAHQVPGLAFQILVYPRVNYKPGPARRSAKDYEDGPILSKDVVAWYRGHFLRADTDQENPLLNPYFREDFAKLPPALLVVAECDPLRDDSYDYQAKMKEAGVKAEVLQIDGASHSFFTKPGIFVECCAVAYKRVTEFIREVAYAK